MIPNVPLITDWIQAIAEAVTAVGICLVLVQTYLLYRQNRDIRQWNKLHGALSLFPDTIELSTLEAELNVEPIMLIDRNQPLSESELKALFEPANHDKRIKLKNFLNLLEKYCVAINYGLADPVLAKALVGSKFTMHFTEMLPYIERVRQTHNAPKYCCELQYAIETWRRLPPPEPRY